MVRDLPRVLNIRAPPTVAILGHERPEVVKRMSSDCEIRVGGQAGDSCAYTCRYLRCNIHRVSKKLPASKSPLGSKKAPLGDDFVLLIPEQVIMA